MGRLFLKEGVFLKLVLAITGDLGKDMSRQKKRKKFSQIDLEKMTEDLKKATYFGILYAALDGISRVETKIHRIVLVKDKSERINYPYIPLEGILRDPWYNNNFIPEKRARNYNEMLIKQLKDFQLNIFRKPIQPYIPRLMIEIHPRGDIPIKAYKSLLIRLNKEIRGLLVSKVEYAIDQHCRTPRDVGNLFWIERRYIYVPYQRSVRLLGGQRTTWGKHGKMNLVSYIGRNFKFYERGNDSSKTGKGWKYEDLNKVRIEHTATRITLKKYGIKTLEEFIKDPKFYEINNKKFQFKQFKKSKKLLREWDAYSTADPIGHCGSFHNEYIASKGKVNNQAQHIKDATKLSELYSKITESMKSFDCLWRDVC